ncbi:hypothetical protein DL98DRAFT_559303 [Cadophora sp. DSE1049]|nr:hypothetical protein DL98DRAFT_559303 [Cadophora sp. DSE1049]
MHISFYLMKTFKCFMYKEALVLGLGRACFVYCIAVKRLDFNFDCTYFCLLSFF